MSEDSDENRQMGVEFGDLHDRLADHDYPASNDELVEAYGEETLVLADDEVTLGELIGEYDTTFESVQEVEEAVLTMVDRDAVGRAQYSDRGGNDPELDETDESM